MLPSGWYQSTRATDHERTPNAMVAFRYAVSANAGGVTMYALSVAPAAPGLPASSGSLPSVISSPSVRPSSSLSASSGSVASLLVGTPRHVRVVVRGQRVHAAARFVTGDQSIIIVVTVDMVPDAVTVGIPVVLAVAGASGAIAVGVDGVIPVGEVILLCRELPQTYLAGAMRARPGTRRPSGTRPSW